MGCGHTRKRLARKILRDHEAKERYVPLRKTAAFPDLVDFWVAAGGPLGALAAPEGQKIPTAIGATAGLLGSGFLNRALLSRLPLRQGGLATKLLLPLLGTGITSGSMILGSRAARKVMGGSAPEYY